MTSGLMTTTAAPPRATTWSTVLGWFAFLFLAASQITAIAISPPDRDMGDLQKIMYVHVPGAWMAMLAPLAVLVFGLRYLWRRREEDDLLAVAVDGRCVAHYGEVICDCGRWQSRWWRNYVCLG